MVIHLFPSKGFKKTLFPAEDSKGSILVAMNGCLTGDRKPPSPPISLYSCLEEEDDETTVC
jgi:hypothetical protein